MRCEKARRWISDGLDGALPDARAAGLERHLEGCAACRAYRRDLELIEAGAGRRPAVEPSPGYWQDFGERLGRKLAASSRPRRTAPRRQGFRKWAWAPATAVAAAAAVLAIVHFGVLRPDGGPDAGWLPNGSSLAWILMEADGDPELTSLLDREVRASIEELTLVPDEDITTPFVDDPLFWEGLSEEELRFIASELETEIDRGGPR
jgi:hypothetical protein